MSKLLLTIIIVLLFLSGCADRDSATLSAYEQYGQSNVAHLTGFNFFIYDESIGEFAFVRKGNVCNDTNSKIIYLTDFINSKLSEDK